MRAGPLNKSSAECRPKLHGDASRCLKPPVDFKTKVSFWPGLARVGQVKVELLFLSRREVLDNIMCHPVNIVR